MSVIAAGRLSSHRVVGATWAGLRNTHGLSPDPDGARFGGTVRVTPAPAAFRDPTVPAPFALHHVRPPIIDQVRRPHRRSTGPPVYATLGTVFDVESGDLFSRLVEALSMREAASLLTIGNHVISTELPRPPPHVKIEPFVPLRDVLGDCAAVICHGGSGTLVAALSLGVPAVVLPMGADQPENADRCRDLGAGIVLDAITCRPADIDDAVRTVLTDEHFAHAARALATEAAAQPPIADVTDITDLLR